MRSQRATVLTPDHGHTKENAGRGGAATSMGFSFGTAMAGEEEETHPVAPSSHAFGGGQDAGMRAQNRKETMHLLQLAKVMGGGGEDIEEDEEIDPDDVPSYKCPIRDENGDLLWLSKSTVWHETQGPVWERPQSAVKHRQGVRLKKAVKEEPPKPIERKKRPDKPAWITASPLNSHLPALGPLPARRGKKVESPSSKPGSCKMAASDDCEDCKWVSESLAKFDYLIKARAALESSSNTKKRRQQSTVALSASLSPIYVKNATPDLDGNMPPATGPQPTSLHRGKSVRHMKAANTREVQINELRQTNLLHRIIAARVTIGEISRAFAKEAVNDEVTIEGFKTIWERVMPKGEMFVMDADVLERVFEVFDADGSGDIDTVEFISLLGRLISPPEKDAEICHLYELLETNDDGIELPRRALSRENLLSLKQARVAKRRWQILAREWQRVLDATPTLPYFLPLDHMRVLVYSDLKLLEAHDRLAPFY